MGVEQRKNQVLVLVPLVSLLGLSFQKVYKYLIYIIKNIIISSRKIKMHPYMLNAFIKVPIYVT